MDEFFPKGEVLTGFSPTVEINSLFKEFLKLFPEQKLRITEEYLRVTFAEYLRITRLRFELCDSYIKNGVMY